MDKENGKETIKSQKENKDKKIELIILVILTIVNFLIGIFNIEQIKLYIIGYILFTMGYMLQIYKKEKKIVYNAILTFPGICIIIKALVGELLETLGVYDISIFVYIHLLLLLSILIIAIILTIVYDVNEEFRKKRLIKCAPLALFALAFFMGGMFNYIFEFIYNF